MTSYAEFDSSKSLSDGSTEVCVFLHSIAHNVIESIGDRTFLKRVFHSYLQHFLSNCWHPSNFDPDVFLNWPAGINKRFSDETHSSLSDGL